MANILLLHLVDIFHEACSLLEEERGRPLSTDVELTMAHRIASYAKRGERDPDRLRALALDGLLEEHSSSSRLH